MKSTTHFAETPNSKLVCDCPLGKNHALLGRPFREHYVTVDNDDDAHPIRHRCVCPFGRDHFADEPIESATRQAATMDINPRYRDDATICLRTRFGQEHERHIYSHIHPEGNGAGFYECPGLDASEAGYPYPVRPYSRTGFLHDDLVVDLVAWWHTYGTSESWGPVDRPLPLALDAAAKAFIEHASRRIRVHVEDEIKRKFIDAGVSRPEPEDLKAFVDAKIKEQTHPHPHIDFRREKGGRPARVWPVRSIQPYVPEGFVVCPYVNDDPKEPWFTYQLGDDGWAWFLYSERDDDYDRSRAYTWGDLNGSTVASGPLVEPLTSGQTALTEVLFSPPRRWEVGSPEPDMPSGFVVVREINGNTLPCDRFIRLSWPHEREDRWLHEDSGGRYTWDRINHETEGRTATPLVEVMPEELR
jgi:hypothetical protein